MARARILYACMALTNVLPAESVSAAPVTVYVRKAPPRGWTLAERAPNATDVEFTLAFHRPSGAASRLQDQFWAVSDPTSKRYGRYWSPEQIAALTRPHTAELALVRLWLQSGGVDDSDINDSGDAWHVRSHAGAAEALFGTAMHYYVHEGGRRVVRQAGAFSMPATVRSVVAFVLNIATFPHPERPLRGRMGGATGDMVGIIPQTVERQYNMTDLLSRRPSTATSQGVIEFDQQSFSPEDLAEFTKLSGTVAGEYPASQIVGPNDPSSGGIEAMLDVEFIATVNPRASNWFWLTPGGKDGWLYAFLSGFAAQPVLPQVISISYDWYESEQCDIYARDCAAAGVDNDSEYVERVNTEFQKLGLRGVSVIVSSGDSGAHTRTDTLCDAPTLRVEYPASSPFVTTVGATQLRAGSAKPLPSQPALCADANFSCAGAGVEDAVSFDTAKFCSGGGFSSLSDQPQPSYQKSAVAAYLSSGVTLPPAVMYNASGRGLPGDCSLRRVTPRD